MTNSKRNNGYEEERQRLQEKRPNCSVNLQPMEQWIKEDTSFCRPCILPVTLDWYQQELSERGHIELVEELDKARMTEDPEIACRAMDVIKDKVTADLRYRLMEFDCSTQEHAAELDNETIPLPDEAFLESSRLPARSLDSESEILPETSPPEPLETEQ